MANTKLECYIGSDEGGVTEVHEEVRKTPLEDGSRWLGPSEREYNSASCPKCKGLRAQIRRYKVTGEW